MDWDTNCKYCGGPAFRRDHCGDPKCEEIAERLSQYSLFVCRSCNFVYGADRTDSTDSHPCRSCGMGECEAGPASPEILREYGA